MNEQTITRREALKKSLGAENYVTFIDALLNFPSRVLRRASTRISFYWSAAFLCASILVIGYGLSALWGELNAAHLALIRTEFLGVVLAYLSLVIFKNARDSVIGRIRGQVLDALDDENDLADLEKWLRLFANVRGHLVFCVVYAFGFWLGLRGEFSGYGSSFILICVAFIWGIPMYFLLAFVLLPCRMGQYHFQLYAPNPSGSQIIFVLARLFQGLVYLYAIVASGSMIFITYSGLLPALALPSLLVAWLPIGLLFAINQYSLAGIITRGKQATLAEIQKQVEAIQKSELLAEKDGMDKLARLMDYHDRVKSTPNAALDLRASLDFVNSLLLPVAGFFIGKVDIDTLLKFIETIQNRLTPP